MSTRSAIIQRMPEGTYRGIYCHSDGYIEYNGVVLHEHYNDPDKVSALIDLGDLSFLDKRATPNGIHSFSDPEEGCTVAYMRDRGERGCEPRTGATIDEVSEQIGHDGYVYVFENGGWSVNREPLAQAIAATA